MAEQFVDITADEPGEGGRGDAARRWFVGPPRWLFGMLVGANVALTVVAYAAPGGYFRAWVLALATWLGLGLAYAARLGLALALGDSWRGLRRSWIRWAVIPAVVVATGALVYTGVPVRAGLQVAKPAMISFAERPDAGAPARVGPYRVDRAERLAGGGARFLLTGTGFVDPAGFAYSPDGPPPRMGEDRYEHLSGPWYMWVESW